MPDKPACPFCGSDENLSGEHIWPDWLGRYPPSKDTVEHKTRNRSRTAPPEHRAYLKRPYRIKASGFCAKCNNGWMSDLDNAAKPYVVSLMEGRSRSLHGPAQRTLSRWVILKTLAFSHTERERTIDQRYYDAFYEARASDPPPCFEVFIARYVGTVTHGIAHVAAMDPVEEPEPGSPLDGYPYIALVSVHHMVLKVYGRDVEGRSEMVHNHRIRNAVWRIWPPRKTFIFPAGGTTLGDMGLEIFMGDRLL
jgi:hypothetical protein